MHVPVKLKVVHEIKFGDICHVNIHNLSYNDRHFNNDWQLEVF